LPISLYFFAFLVQFSAKAADQVIVLFLYILPGVGMFLKFVCFKRRSTMRTLMKVLFKSKQRRKQAWIIMRRLHSGASFFFFFSVYNDLCGCFTFIILFLFFCQSVTVWYNLQHSIIIVSFKNTIWSSIC